VVDPNNFNVDNRHLEAAAEANRGKDHDSTPGAGTQPPPPGREERLVHVDVARGLSILLVVLGHNWMVLHDTGEPYLVIYSFHIPLFLLLSGVFFNPNLPFWQSAWTRADALLKPYMVTLTAVAIQLGWFANKTTPFLESLAAILYGNARIPIWIPLWFLPHLFLLCIFTWLYLAVFQLEKRHPVIRAGLLLVSLAAGYFMLRWFWPIKIPLGAQEITLRGLPFSADLLLVTSFYFILGYLFRERIKQPAPKYGWTLLAMAVFLRLQLVFNDSMDLNLRKYDNLVISTLQALAGIYLMLSISRMLSGIAPLARLLSYLGRNSLIILIFHNPIQRSLFNILGDALERKYAAGVLAFVIAVLACLLIAEAIRRIPILKFLYLPVTHTKGK
jgi:polysaccharide biosynthesis protein PslL